MMAGFEKLCEVSNLVSSELQRSSELFFSVTNGKQGEDILNIDKRIRDIKIFAAKLKLLQAKPKSYAPDIKNQPQENALQEYNDTVSWKVIENMTVSSITQGDAVKTLISTPDENLLPEMRLRKKAIKDSILEYHQKESRLNSLDAILKQLENEYAELRAQWDRALGSLRDMQDQRSAVREMDNEHYIKLKAIVKKLELLRWLIGKMVCARSPYYDWITDPHGRVSVLAHTRVQHTVEMFTCD